MGFKTFTIAGGGIIAAWAVRHVLDTPYDWLAFLTALMLLAWAFPDDVLERWWAMMSWVVRQRLKYLERV